MTTGVPCQLWKDDNKNEKQKNTQDILCIVNNSRRRRRGGKNINILFASTWKYLSNDYCCLNDLRN